MFSLTSQCLVSTPIKALHPPWAQPHNWLNMQRTRHEDTLEVVAVPAVHLPSRLGIIFPGWHNVLWLVSIAMRNTLQEGALR